MIKRRGETIKLEQVLDTADFFKDLLNLHHNSTFAITDLEKFLYIHDGMQLGIKAGDKIKPGSATDTTIKQRKPYVHTFDGTTSLYQTEYTSMTMPIVDEAGRVIGTASWTIPTNQAKLSLMAGELSGVTKQFAAQAEAFAANAGQLSQANQTMSRLIEQLVGQMATIEEINRLIAGLSSQSQLLGLNAAIEAAHAGEFGRGFSVVADQIRKLATESENSAKKISERVEATKKQIEEIFNMSQNLNRYCQQQVDGSTQIAAAIEQLGATASTLLELSDE